MRIPVRRGVVMTQRAAFSAPGGGTELSALDAVHTVRIGADDTGGLYELFEIYAPRGHAVPAHRHTWLEAYYVLSGRMTAHVDGIAYELPLGASLTVPSQALHTFVPVTPSVTFLVFTLTDAMGKFFADLSTTVPADRPIQDVIHLVLDVAERHGVTFPQPVAP
jgi:quercetin dioxygenase-like cupin family protein